MTLLELLEDAANAGLTLDSEVLTADGNEITSARADCGQLYLSDESEEYTNVIKDLSTESALVYWVTALQTHFQQTPPKLMVLGYDEANDSHPERHTEIDYFIDDATNLIDGTWREPILVYEN